MKQLSLLLCILLLTACQNQTTSTTNLTALSSEEEQIAKDLIQGAFDDIWGNLDSNKISQYHTDDFLLLEHGEIWKNETIKKYIRRQLPEKDNFKRINKMDYISIEKHGPSIQIAYHNYAKIIKSDSIEIDLQWLESALAIPTKEGWRLKMLHSTHVKRQNN